jgi:cytidyltransferase-like protein
VTGLLGGTFNPPHNGHLALARAAQEHFDLDGVTVLVAERPGHKEVQLDADTRLKLAQLPFPTTRSSPIRTSVPSTCSARAIGASRCS